jgi:penicillin-binding protein activator
MKRLTVIALVALCSLSFFTACSSNPSVKRVDADTQTDLSGYWNDTDVRIVADSLIKDCLSSARIAQFEAKKGKLPVVIVGSFKNDSDEHIDTSIITKKMETAILNSGKADFVASSSERTELRTERQEQQGFASEATAKALANETGADFMMIGSVKTIVDKAGKTATRTYFVYGEMIDLETNKKIWMGENSEIKKVIKTSSTKL